MDRKTRICVWIILLGLLNFLAYTILYVFIGGEAVNGHVLSTPQGYRYILQSGAQVSHATFVYSGVHSISIWLTVGAVMLAMLTLAKERIASAVRSRIMHGRTFITVLATIIGMITAVMTVWFILHFVRCLTQPRPAAAAQTQSVSRL